MESLRKLNDELGNPSQQKLLRAAKKRKLNVTAAQVKEVVKEDSTREIFGKPQAAKGHHITDGENSIWQGDIIDLKDQGNEEFKYALSVTNVFDRKTNTEPLKTKSQTEVWSAFEKILTKFGSKPSKLSVDAGEEFSGSFEQAAKARGIVVQSKLNNDPNAIAISDRAVQSIKNQLFRRMAKEGSDKWTKQLPKATKAYNETPHSALMNEAPEDVKKQGVVRFRLMQENAEKMKGNAKQLQARQKRLMEAGAFRAPLAKQTFQRGFKPKFGGQVKSIDKVEGGIVTSGGQRYNIASVLPVNKDTAKNVDWRPEGNARQELQRFVPELRKFLLGEGGKSMTAASTHMRGIPGFEAAMQKFKLDRQGGFKDFVQLFDSTFEVQGPTTGPGQKTIRVRKRRLVGKQRA